MTTFKPGKSQETNIFRSIPSTETRNHDKPIQTRKNAPTDGSGACDGRRQLSCLRALYGKRRIQRESRCGSEKQSPDCSPSFVRGELGISVFALFLLQRALHHPFRRACAHACHGRDDCEPVGDRDALPTLLHRFQCGITDSRRFHPQS